MKRKTYTYIPHGIMTTVIGTILILLTAGCEVDVSYEYEDRRTGETVKKSYSNTDRFTKLSEIDTDTDTSTEWDNESAAEQSSGELQEYDSGYYSIRYPWGWQKVEDPNLDDIDPLNELSLIQKNMQPLNAVVLYNSRNDRQYIKLAVSPTVLGSFDERNMSPRLSGAMSNTAASFQETMERDYGFTKFSKSQSVEQFQTYRCYRMRLTGANEQRELTVHLLLIPNNTNNLTFTIIYTESGMYEAQENQTIQDIIDSIVLYF